MENKMKEMNQLLRKLNACKGVRDWAQGKTFEEVYTTCHRGDWLNWLFAKTNPEDLRILTLVKGQQANTVRHLMKDERSLNAIDTAIAFGEGRATKEDLRKAAEAARAAADAADADDAAWAAASAAWAARAAASAARASYAAICAADASFAASYAAIYTAFAAAWAVASADTTFEAAEAANQRLTAEIFRQYISIDKFKI